MLQVNNKMDGGSVIDIMNVVSVVGRMNSVNVPHLIGVVNVTGSMCIAILM